MLDGNNLADWRWRFGGNLYWIKPADDKPAVRFTPRPAQWEILEEIYDQGLTREAILKSRQLGFSTLLALICLDFLLFRPGCRVGIVDLTADHAEKKRGKIKLAWEMLPTELKEEYEVVHDARGSFAIRLAKEELNDQTRYLYAGKSPRGDTFQLLWISEWGPIQIEDALRSDAIADEGLPAVNKGTCVVETTWRGGKTGRLYTEVVEESLKIPEDELTLDDWRIHFYPWYLDPELRREGGSAQISDPCRKYLKQVEPLAIEEAQRMGFDFDGFDDAQRLWYFKVAWPKRHKRYEEYPTVMTEIFLAPEPGAIYTEEMSDLRLSRRLTRVPVERAHKVIIPFDLGRDDAMPFCFIQLIGHEIRVPDYHTSNRELVDYYVNYILEWCARHQVKSIQIVLPHDSRSKGIITESSIEMRFRELLRDCGLLWEVTVNDVIARVWDGIDDVRSIFPYLVMDSERCSEPIRKGDFTFPSLTECLDRYHSIQMIDGRNTTMEPVHDKYCHGADALRTFAEGYAKGRITKAGVERRPVRIAQGHGEISGLKTRTRRLRIRK